MSSRSWLTGAHCPARARWPRGSSCCTARRHSPLTLTLTLTRPLTLQVASRLELLQSPAPRERAFQLHPSDFELVDEPLSEEGGGCGFIPEELLERLLGGRGAPNPGPNTLTPQPYPYPYPYP